MGKYNFSLSKPINYPAVVGATMQPYEDIVNMANFGDLKKTEPIDRNSKRVGLLATK